MNRRILSLLISLIFISVNCYAGAPPGQTCSAGGFSAATSGACFFASVTTTNRLIVCSVHFQDTSTTISSVTDTGGGNTYTTIGPATGTGNRTYMLYSVLANGGWQTLTVNFSGSATGDVLCAEYSGMATASPLDCVSSGGSGNGTALDGGTCTPANSNDLFVGGGMTMTNSVTYTAGTGYTVEAFEAHGALGNSAALEDKNSSSCLAQSASMTGSLSGQWSMLTAAFKTSSPTACITPTSVITTSPGSGIITTSPGTGLINSR